MSAPLAGRVAVVSGANHGIGAATAMALARLGADVLVTYLSFEPDDHDPSRPGVYAEQRRQSGLATLSAVTATGQRGHSIEADLCDPEAPRRIFDEAEAVLGPVSILVNNASGWKKDSFLSQGVDAVGREHAALTRASVDAQLLVDARGGALMIAEMARRHIERGDQWGRIIGLTSGGPAGFPGEVSYGAAKAALENYTMSAAAELADRGITANIVHPPVTDTGWITDEVTRFVATSPEHTHIAQPGAVADVIAWLCTDEAGLVTGSVLRLR